MVIYITILVKTLHIHDSVFTLPAKLIKMRRAYVTCFEWKWSGSDLC
jgi:hypothetical protein